MKDISRNWGFNLQGRNQHLESEPGTHLGGGAVDVRGEEAALRLATRPSTEGALAVAIRGGDCASMAVCWSAAWAKMLRAFKASVSLWRSL
jgi:hypothetical protein